MPSPLPPNDSDDDPLEPVSYFTLEQRRRSNDLKLGGEPLPPLPASHWSNDPCGPEPTIDRNVEDGPTIDINQER
jgi:hypothetical protein